MRGPRAGAGRPSKRYRVVAPDALDLPLRHDDVLVELLEALAALGPERAEQLAEAWAWTTASHGSQHVALPTGTGRSRRRCTVVADALTAHGFRPCRAPRRRASASSASTARSGVAIEHPVICAVDRGMVQGMLEALYGHQLTTETALSLPTGGEHCVTAVQGNRGPDPRMVQN